MLMVRNLLHSAWSIKETSHSKQCALEMVRMQFAVPPIRVHVSAKEIWVSHQNQILTITFFGYRWIWNFSKLRKLKFTPKLSYNQPFNFFHLIKLCCSIIFSRTFHRILEKHMSIQRLTQELENPERNSHFEYAKFIFMRCSIIFVRHEQGP